LKTYVLLVATDAYLLAVENGDLPLLATQQRLDFTEQMAWAAVMNVDGEANECRNLTAEYQKRIEHFFSSNRTVLRLWKKFEYQQAEVDGRLSPQRIIADLLGDVHLAYGQQSTLETYAVIAIQEAKKNKYDLTRTLRFVRKFVQARPLFVEIRDRFEVAQA
jgi:hypothetical protein